MCHPRYVGSMRLHIVISQYNGPLQYTRDGVESVSGNILCEGFHQRASRKSAGRKSSVSKRIGKN